MFENKGIYMVKINICCYTDGLITQEAGNWSVCSGIKGQ